ncbi:MAG: DUF86 domain-containing protein [Phycisphaerales bacterium]|nr:DUF86 domain-containing protein [Phycisphaerales bacterium]
MHMLAAAKDAAQFIAGPPKRRREDLDADPLLRRGLTHAVQEIGEAAARVSPTGRARASGVPWGQIVQMRHFLVHVYWGVKLDHLWLVVERDLPSLIGQLERTLSEWPDDPT